MATPARGERPAEAGAGAVDGSGEHVPDPARWKILSVLLVTVFMTLAGVSIVNVVLPSIQAGLGASQSDLQWVLSGYALTFGVVLVAAGRAGDILGRGPLFIAGVAVFTLSSVAAGLAPDPGSLNIARFVQGLGSGLVNPQAAGMIQQYFRGPERGRAFGILGGMVGLSVAVGPLLGGLAVQFAGPDLGWRLTFLVNVPVGVLAIVLAARWFPRPLRNRVRSARRFPTGHSSPGRGRRLDLDPVGAVLLGVSVLFLLLPFVERRSGGWVWTLLPAGVAVMAAWVAWERRCRRRGHSPMVDLALFRTRSFSAGTAIAGLYFMGVTSVWVLVALYLQDGLGRSALDAGLMGVPAAVVGALSSVLAGRRVAEHGRMIVLAGICSALLGLGLSIAVIQLEAAGAASIWWLLATLSFIGLAQGMVIATNQALTLADVPLDYAGSAGGVLQTGQRIGTAVGIALITAVAFSVLAATGWAAAISTGFGVTAAVLMLTLAVAAAEARQGPRRPHRAFPGTARHAR